MAGELPHLRQLLTDLQSRGDDLAQQCAEAVQPFAPVKTGALRDSLIGTSASTGDGLHITVTSGVKEATFVVEGTAPHAIVARESGALRFEVQGGTVVYARRVQHPGTKANDFGAQAVGALTAIVEQAVAAAVAHL